jgi:hypothetical protein
LLLPAALPVAYLGNQLDLGRIKLLIAKGEISQVADCSRLLITRSMSPLPSA